MGRRDVFTKILAILGTLLTVFTALAPFIFGLASLIAERRYLLDWLMPAEFFPAALAGGLLLLWAALRARSRRAWAGWSLGSAAVLLAGGMAVASLSGLASGAIAPRGIWWGVVTACILLYWLAVAAMAVGGGLLIGDLFRRSEP